MTATQTSDSGPSRSQASGSGTRELEAEFLNLYRRPGARYLLIACAFGCAVALSFYLIDALAPGHASIERFQHMRLALAAAFFAVALICWTIPKSVIQHYIYIFGVFAMTAVAASCYAAYYGHRHETPLELINALNLTLVACITVIFSFSRLTASATAMLTGLVSAMAIVFLWTLHAAELRQLARMTTHLVILTACCFSLRLSVQRREWELFLLAKENLRRNTYAAELEKAKAAVDLADAAKSRFLANMSHEIRTPMNGVLQILELVRDHAQTEDRILIEKGRRAGEALLRILNSILDYAKLSQGQVEVQIAAVDIADLCKTTLALHVPAAITKGIELRSRLDFPPATSCVFTDEVKLFEIVNNLLSNALKFTQSGYVSLNVQMNLSEPGKLPAGMLDISVDDSGPGLSLLDQSRVFVPFYQRETPSGERPGGTGLGLSIVRELVSKLGGHIKVESTVGIGSSFQVSLPITISVEASVLEVSLPRTMGKLERTSAEEFSGRKLLLVEDNELNSMLASRVMQSLGFEVDLASNGAVAVELVSRKHFDIILMDCQMPVMDGYQASRLIRALEASRSSDPTPIIAVTAYALSGDRAKCLAAGMDDYLEKPYSVLELRPKLIHWLDKPRDDEGISELRIKRSTS